MTSFDTDHVQSLAADVDTAAWLKPAQEAALAAFADLELPHTKLEAWRKTSLRPLTTTKVRWPRRDASAPAVAKELGHHLRLIVDGGQVMHHEFVGGDVVDGVTVRNAADASADEQAAFGKVVARRGNAMNALNTSLASEVCFISVDDDVNVRIVVQHVHEEAGGDGDEGIPLAVHRLVLAVGENANVDLIEEDVDDAHPFVASRLFEAQLQKGAQLTHSLECELKDNQDVLREIHVALDESAQFHSFALPIGGRIHRTDLNVHLDGHHAETTSYGAIVADQKNLVDIHSLIHHHVGLCTSQQEIRGILAEEGHGVFNGHVIFEKDAQKSDTAQKNPNLLLSRDAIIDTQPVLEIYADDVTASHGSTVGQLDADAYFYLRSRGIDEDEAYRMLVRAFVHDVMHQTRGDDVHDRFAAVVDARLDAIVARSEETEG